MTTTGVLHAMQTRCETIIEAVGRTPIVRIHRLTERLSTPIYAKVEAMNPGGSVKDRIALAMIEAAERQGLLKPGGTIIEATAGNTGVGLAMVAAVKGYRCIFVMPDKMSAEKIRLLKSYGAEVVVTPSSAPSNSPDGYGGVAARLVNEIPNAWQPNQFTNLENPEIHYRLTGPEIWEQTEGRITVFVAGIGTGGTISGAGRYLKEQSPHVKVVAADPEGSILSGSEPRPWAVEGIGEDYVPKTFNSQVVDEWIQVSDAESFRVARDLARLEGLLVGGSSGTAMAAALKFAQRLTTDDLVVVLCPDTGRNYMSKMFSDEWMIEKGFLTLRVEPKTVGNLLESQGPVELISVGPDGMAEDAIGLLRMHDISQLPVIEDGKVVGSVRELTVAKLLYENRDPRQVPIREVMAPPMPIVAWHVDIQEVYRLLSAGHTGVLVERDGRLVGIVTRIDLIDFWDAPFRQTDRTMTPTRKRRRAPARKTATGK